MKKQYMKPSVKVVNLQVQSQLLAGSDEKPSTTIQSYHWNNEVEE